MSSVPRWFAFAGPAYLAALLAVDTQVSLRGQLALGVVSSPELDEDAVADLVMLAANGVIDAPASRLGRYLVRNWEQLSLVREESLVYWLRKLIFRGAWLDHQVKRGALEVTWDDGEAEFAYQHPGGGGRPLLELAPVPSWHELQFRP